MCNKLEFDYRHGEIITSTISYFYLLKKIVSTVLYYIFILSSKKNDSRLWDEMHIFKERGSSKGVIARVITMAKNVEMARLVDEVGSLLLWVGGLLYSDNLKLNMDPSLEEEYVHMEEA